MDSMTKTLHEAGHAEHARDTARLMRARTAHHEAAHALVGWFYGYRLHKVSILADGEARGRCGASPPGVIFVDEPDFLTAEKVYFLLAGRAVDEIRDPGAPNGHQIDFKILKDLKVPDQITTEMLAFGFAENTEAFYARFKSPVVKLLRSPHGKRCLARLSSALLKHGVLSGQEVACILEKSWRRPLPAAALPIEGHMALTDDGPRCFADLMRATRTYLSVIEKDIKAVRDCGTDEENTQMDLLWSKFVVFKTLL